MNHKPWQSIFDSYKIHEHDFSKSPFILTAEQIKKATVYSPLYPKTFPTTAKLLPKPTFLYLDYHLIFIGLCRRIYWYVQLVWAAKKPNKTPISAYRPLIAAICRGSAAASRTAKPQRRRQP